MTDPSGHETQYEYSNLEMVSVTKGFGTAQAATTSYVYDPATLGIATETNADGDVTSNTYDADGNLLTTTDPLGNTTTYTYNDLSEILTEIDPLGFSTSNGYDARGNLRFVDDPFSDLTTYAYGDGNHPGDVTSMTDPDQHVTSYKYDADGDVVSASVSPSAGVTDTTGYAYDTDGERTCTARPDAVAAGTSCPAAGSPAKAGTRATGYDADGETTSATDADGHKTTYAYDPDGDVTKVTSPAGQVTTYAYNGLGEQVKATLPGARAQVTSYAANGSVTSQANAAGNATRYAYNALGEEVSSTDPLGHITRYAYDKAGNRTSLTDPQGRVTSYAYDADGHVTGLRYSTGTTPAVSYSYDADGDRSSMRDGTGTTRYFYDADRRLTSVTNAAGQQVSYGYDEASFVTSLTYPNGSVVTRGYDGAGQLTSVRDWRGNVTRFGYDHSGNLTSETYPDGVIARPSYDDDGLLTSLTDMKGTSPLASFTYSRNTMEEVAKDTDTGAVTGTQSYGYTPQGQLASDTSGSFTYNAAGQLTAQPGGETQAYNAGGELTSTSAKGVKAAYAYNTDGDLTRAGSTGLAYNQANELTGYGTSAHYAYDGDGLRMSKTVSGKTTEFAWDSSGGLPLLIAAGTTYYLYGPDDQPIEQLTGATPAYLLADQSGSTRLILNNAGAVTGTYTYGPYGAVTRHTGSATTALQYDGQYTDGESGLQYLQARYYDPATGQFLTVDPLVALTNQPYGYAYDDPANFADPSGALSFGELFAAATLVALIGALFGAYSHYAYPEQNHSLPASTCAGAVSGFVSGLCTVENPWGIAACSAAGAAAGDLVKQYGFKQDVPGSDYFWDMSTAAVAGPAAKATFPASDVGNAFMSSGLGLAPNTVNAVDPGFLPWLTQTYTSAFSSNPYTSHDDAYSTGVPPPDPPF